MVWSVFADPGRTLVRHYYQMDLYTYITNDTAADNVQNMMTGHTELHREA